MSEHDLENLEQRALDALEEIRQARSEKVVLTVEYKAFQGLQDEYLRSNRRWLFYCAASFAAGAALHALVF